MQPKIDVAACRSALGNGQCSENRFLHLMGEHAKQFAHSILATRAHPLAKYSCVAESRHSFFLWCCSHKYWKV